MNKYPIIILSIIFLIIAHISIGQNFDINTLKKINGNESSFKTNYFNTAANSVAVLNIVAPTSIYIAGEIKHNAELKKDALYMAGAFVFSTAVTHITKNIVKRKRPFEEYSFIVKRSDGGGYSFPSGHTSAAFTTATSLSLYFPKWYVIAPAYLWASSVGYARMYEGVHYPTDVIVGAVVGAGSAWLGFKIQQWMDKKHTTHNKISNIK